MTISTGWMRRYILPQLLEKRTFSPYNFCSTFNGCSVERSGTAKRLTINGSALSITYLFAERNPNVPQKS